MRGDSSPIYIIKEVNIFSEVWSYFSTAPVKLCACVIANILCFRYKISSVTQKRKKKGKIEKKRK